MPVQFNTTAQLAAVTKAKSLIQNGVERETVIGFLREQGFNKIASINAVAYLYGTSIPQAKEIVHFSHSWEDCRSRDEQLHESLFEALEKGELDLTK
ncbi:MAG TPA: hypothetical protein VHT24_14665 [Pseudacidobacterium sp.]|jgi:hypothetical protein|nr:hypothetical protein [Pseudacidobacterium sp.]